MIIRKGSFLGSPSDELVERLFAAGVTQQELADAVGSVREFVVRILRDFRQPGVIATAPDRVHLLDPGGRP